MNMFRAALLQSNKSGSKVKTILRAIILAETEEEAKAKFTSKFGDYENARIAEGHTYIRVTDTKTDIYTF